MKNQIQYSSVGALAEALTASHAKRSFIPGGIVLGAVVAIAGASPISFLIGAALVFVAVQVTNGRRRIHVTLPTVPEDSAAASLMKAFDRCRTEGRAHLHVFPKGDQDGTCESPKSATLKKGAPKYLRTTPAPVVSGAADLVFLPDGLLLKVGRVFTPMPYAGLQVSGSSEVLRASEPGRPGEQLTISWRYSRTGGGPDRRYKNNPRLALIDFKVLRLTHEAAGVGVALYLSANEAAIALQHSIEDKRSTADALAATGACQSAVTE